MHLNQLRGFALDLDGTLWAGHALLPGAAELVAALRHTGRRLVFLSNNSRMASAGLAERLTGLGIPARPDDVVGALDLLGTAIRDRHGATTVLALGAGDMESVLREAGHIVVPPDRYVEARAVALGNDPTFDYPKLRAATRAILAGASFFASNLDIRFPAGAGLVDPGCGALAAAVATASGVEPVVVGKPHAFMFTQALTRLGCGPEETAMIGDNPDTDIAGGRAAGLFTVQVGAGETYGPSEHADLAVRDVRELLAVLEENGVV